MGGRYDLVVVGMGSGGMVAAEFAATLPLRVAVVERDRVGGDCLWTGCVPSKALISSARVAHQIRTADRWGLRPQDPEIDTTAVWRRVRAIQDDIATSDDDPRRYEAMGIELVKGEARLLDPHTVAVGQRRLPTRFVLLCTGSRPATVPIAGLAEAGYLTNETVFSLEQVPRSMTLIGGGPIAIELAQALHRLGVQATVLQRPDRILPRDQPELVAALSRLLADEGVRIETGVDISQVISEGGLKVVHALQDGTARRWESEELLVAVGRQPNVEPLGLEALGIEVNRRGVVVDDRLRSSVPSIYAAGDVAGRALFTHAAAYEATRAVRDMFFPGKGTADALVPWCTFTDPELAHAGLTEAEARQRHGDSVAVHRVDLAHSDRARADSHAEGSIVVVTAGKTIVGAHVLAPAAGEIVHELALAIQHGLHLDELASLIHVYPTLSSSVGRLAADAAFARARRFAWVVPLGRAWDRLRRR